MNTGMLWYDNNPKQPLSKKIERAAEYYQNKYGQAPNLCLINPGEALRESVKIPGITVRPYRPILPKHLWLGVETEEAKK